MDPYVCTDDFDKSLWWRVCHCHIMTSRVYRNWTTSQHLNMSLKIDDVNDMLITHLFWRKINVNKKKTLLGNYCDYHRRMNFSDRIYNYTFLKTKFYKNAWLRIEEIGKPYGLVRSKLQSKIIFSAISVSLKPKVPHLMNFE